MAVHASEPGVARRDNVNWFELGNLTGGSGGTSGQLSETGWTASSNTNSSAGDAPQNAINGTGAAVSSTSAGPSDVVSYS